MESLVSAATEGQISRLGPALGHGWPSAAGRPGATARGLSL